MVEEPKAPKRMIVICGWSGCGQELVRVGIDWKHEHEPQPWHAPAAVNGEARDA